MSSYDRQDVYQGPRVAAMSQDVGRMPRDVLAQERKEGNEQARQNVTSLSHEVIQAHDYFNATNDEEDIDATCRMAQDALAARMRLPDDAEDSLIDPATGQVSQAKLGEFMKPIQEKLDIAGRGIVDPETRMKVRAHAVKARNDIAVFMANEAVKLQGERDEFAFNKRFFGAQDREDYGAMLAAVDDAERRRVLSPAQAWEKRRSVQRLMKLKAGTASSGSNEAVPQEHRKKTEKPFQLNGRYGR